MRIDSSIRIRVALPGRCVIASLMLLIAVMSAGAQTVGGTMTGRVTDPSGRSFPA